MENIRRSYQESLKRKVVSEVEEGRLSQTDASREYGIPRTLVRLWLEEYGKYRPKKDIVEVVMKSEKDRIAELEKALADATLKARIYEELIKEADKEYKIDIKKTFGTGLSAFSNEKGKTSQKSPKRLK